MNTCQAKVMNRPGANGTASTQVKDAGPLLLLLSATLSIAGQVVAIAASSMAWLAGDPLPGEPTGKPLTSFDSHIGDVWLNVVIVIAVLCLARLTFRRWARRPCMFWVVGMTIAVAGLAQITLL